MEKIFEKLSEIERLFNELGGLITEGSSIEKGVKLGVVLERLCSLVSDKDLEAIVRKQLFEILFKKI